MEQRESVDHIKDWDDLLHEPSREVTKEGREGALEKLAQAAQQAYARGDENHPDWNQLAELVEELRPEDNANRRLSNDQEVSKKAEKEQVEYHFFSETLPVIRKASVVAALNAPNNFQTAELVEKAREVHEAWKNAKGKFGDLLKKQYIDPDSNNATIVGETSSFLEDSMMAADQKEEPVICYFQHFDYEVEHWRLNCELSQIHNEVMQCIIKAGVCTRDFETRTDSKKTDDEYDTFLQKILEAKEKADPEVQEKWEQFHQEAAARCLEDLSQVAKIKLWQNRNQVASINKLAERVHERAERAATATSAAAWQRALKEGEAVKDVWIERNNQLAAARRNIEAHKSTLVLKISTAIEKEIEGAISEAEQAIAY